MFDRRKKEFIRTDIYKEKISLLWEASAIAENKIQACIKGYKIKCFKKEYKSNYAVAACLSAQRAKTLNRVIKARLCVYFGEGSADVFCVRFGEGSVDVFHVCLGVGSVDDTTLIGKLAFLIDRLKNKIQKHHAIIMSMSYDERITMYLECYDAINKVYDAYEDLSDAFCNFHLH